MATVITTPLATMRIDRALVERGYAVSRTRAQALIAQGKVAVNGTRVEEGDVRVGPKDKITLLGEDIKWVSRAGLKLEHALTHWKIDVSGKVALDIGASTGGFTDVLLWNGAKKIYALDVGHGQLAEKLKKDRRVVNLEKHHINDATKKLFREPIHIITVDISFISLEKVLPKIKELLAPGGTLIALIKPQFEVGKQHVKKGVVRDPKLHATVARKIEDAAVALGLDVRGVIASPIYGGDGNREFLLYATVPEGT